MHKPKERWKLLDNPNYAVSTHGNVKNRKTGRILKPFKVGSKKRQSQYYSVDIAQMGNNLKIHRLVLGAFIGPSKLTVNHIDGNKLNNVLSNLEYCTVKENIRHSWKIGLAKAQRGSKNGNSRLTEKQVKEIRKAKSIRNCVLAEMYGVTPTLIGYIKIRKNWKWL